VDSTRHVTSRRATTRNAKPIKDANKRAGSEECLHPVAVELA
jgi:hypothetical protein